MTEFAEYVEEWRKAKAAVDDLSAKLKRLRETEMAMRRAIVASVNETQPLKEGVNRFPIDGGPTLKINRKIDRKIDESQIANAREAFQMTNDRPSGFDFDDLLRIKYELAIAPFRKIEGEAAKAVSLMITSKDAAPDVELE